MANTSVAQFLDTLHGVLGFANNTGSVNLYMAHGGTNFGFTAGATLPPPNDPLCVLPLLQSPLYFQF